MGSTDIAGAWLTGKVWLRVPETIRLVYTGTPQPWVTGKDLILHTLGDLGADGATYQALEFTGDAISNLSMDGRFTMSNMAVEGGAKAGIFEVDQKTIDYMNETGCPKDWTAYQSDPDASYAETRTYDMSNIDPQVAAPHSPANVKSVREFEGSPIGQVVIGSCTNGRLEDIETAAKILKGKKVHPGLRLIVIPATTKIYLEALKMGFIETIVEAGGVFSPSTCGCCFGGPYGRARARRTVCFHDQPELHRKDGASRKRGVPGGPVHRGRFGRCRKDRAPPCNRIVI